MNFANQVLVILLISGLILVGAEIFMPGGILGTIGGIALVAAVIMSFAQFGPVMGGYIALAVIFLVGLAIFLWVKIFPRTKIGKQMTVQRDLRDSRGDREGLESLLGKDGVALSTLRPSGFARIDGRRIDVITQGSMIDKGASIRVVNIEGNRVVVRPEAHNNTEE